ncbi:MAG: hypothetical protein EB149_07955, partial [Thaumarchaeota archaeon]|nr:hypothetical protein [Nitrososphaerota archaeon]
MDNYLSKSQHAYRSKRSTTEAVWTMQYTKATIQTYKERYLINSIDLSKAFDCIDRKKLIEIFEKEKIADEDELRILSYLLSNTKLRVRIGNVIGRTFSTTIGTPQGDALSPVLFLVYMESILREYRETCTPSKLDLEVSYADDVNFVMHDNFAPESNKNIPTHETDGSNAICMCVYCKQKHLENTLPEITDKYNMQMNHNKTEKHLLTYNEAKKTNYKILGNYIRRENEIKNRKQKAQTAFNAMNKIWLNKKNISIKTKVRLYNALVLPHILYNAATSTYRGVQKDQINSFHRKQLRRLIGVYFPKHISNKKLYEKTGTRPITIDITKQRWQLFGHICRLDADVPANAIMTQYYKLRFQGDTWIRKAHQGGKKNLTLPRILDDDIKNLPIEHRRNTMRLTEFKNGSHLKTLRDLAQDRNAWKKVVHNMANSEKERWEE